MMPQGYLSFSKLDKAMMHQGYLSFSKLEVAPPLSFCLLANSASTL
jgi:hypothetical protein